MKLRQICLQFAAAVGILSLTGCNACTEQHNPRPDQEIFKKERRTGNATLPKLNDDGSLPKVEKSVVKGDSAATSNENPGVKKYQQFCAPCHGSDGAAASATALAMNPKPRAFTDAAWQNATDDARITKVIKEGGAAVGLSATMAPWGAMVSDQGNSPNGHTDKKLQEIKKGP